MAISLIKIPSNISFVENPIAIQVGTDNYATTVGTYATVVIDTATFQPTNGTNINFNFAGETNVLKFLTIPGMDQWEIFHFLGIANYKTILANSFTGNTLISNTFIVTTVGDSVVLTARNKGDLAIVFASAGITISQGTAELTNPNLKIQCRLDVNNEYVNMVLPLNENGEAIFYLDKILQSFLYNENMQILLPDTAPQLNLPIEPGYRNIETQKKYKVWLAELDTETNVLSKYIYAGVICNDYFTVFTGGTSKFAPRQNPVDLFPISYLCSILTHQAKANKKLSYSQPEWVTFCSSTTELNLRVKYTLTNKTTGTITTVTVPVLQNISFNQKFTIPFSLKHVMPVGFVVSDYSKYTVEVFGPTSAAQTILWTNTYFLIPDCGNYRYFTFENSLGGIDCLRLEGQFHSATKSKKTTANIITGINRSSKNGDQTVFNVQNTEIIKVKSHFFNDFKLAEYYKELFYSKRLFELVLDPKYYSETTNFKPFYLPIKIKSSSLKTGVKTDISFRLKLDYEYLNTEHSY